MPRKGRCSAVKGHPACAIHAFGADTTCAKSLFQIHKQAYRIHSRRFADQDSRMALQFPEHNFIFTLAELQRVVRSYAEQKVSRYGVTRAQWAVLAKLEKT